MTDFTIIRLNIAEWAMTQVDWYVCLAYRLDDGDDDDRVMFALDSACPPKPSLTRHPILSFSLVIPHYFFQTE